MGNIIDYVREYGQYDFSEKPVCKEDILTLAQLAYIKFDGLIPSIARREVGMTLAQLNARITPDVVFAEIGFGRHTLELWREMAGSRRFGGMRCDFLRNRLDEEQRIQFCAMTFFPEHAMPVVAFRGTDETIVGWQEDFNLAFRAPIPAQKESAVYLNQVSCQLEGDFVVCGHSKGGNLAIYASMLAKESTQARIAAIYSFDGPGFHPDVLTGDSYERIKGKIHRILPASSLVGMLLQNYESYEVVKTNTFGVLQHMIFSWQIEDGKLVRLQDIESKQKKMNEVLNRFVYSMAEEELRLFVDTLFGVIRKTGAETVTEFARDWKQNLKICLKQIREMDPETGEKMRQMLRILFEIAADVNFHPKNGE